MNEMDPNAIAYCRQSREVAALWSISAKAPLGDFDSGVAAMTVVRARLAPIRAAITAALGDGALVVTAERLRAALERAWLDGHSYTGTGYLSDGRFDAIVAELAAAEVEG